MRPITSQPGHAEAELSAILLTRQFIWADCYTIFPRYGDPIRLTTRDRPVEVIEDGEVVTYDNTGKLIISGMKLKLSVGMEVDQQEVKLNYSSDSMLWGMPVPKAIRLGRLDGSIIHRDRYIAADTSLDWVGSVPLFRGRMSNADKIDRASASFTAKSDLVLLNTKIPTELYQPNCNHVLYDPGCGLDRNNFKVESTVEAGTTSSLIICSSSIPELALGVLYIDTSDGITLIRTIKSASGSQFELAYPLDYVPQPGDSFTAYQGCDRTRARCTQLNNISRYKGFPYIPVAETAI